MLLHSFQACTCAEEWPATRAWKDHHMAVSLAFLELILDNQCHHLKTPRNQILCAEGSGAGGVQTAKASPKQSSLSGKESAQGCIPKRLLGRPD